MTLAKDASLITTFYLCQAPVRRIKYKYTSLGNPDSIETLT